jgi:restriction endonuclease Mrr
MDEHQLDTMVAGVVVGLLKARRVIDPETFEDLITSIMVDIDVGLQVAEEEALEAVFRRPSGNNVVAFPLPRRPNR